MPRVRVTNFLLLYGKTMPGPGSFGEDFGLNDFSGRDHQGTETVAPRQVRRVAVQEVSGLVPPVSDPPPVWGPDEALLTYPLAPGPEPAIDMARVPGPSFIATLW